MKEFLQQAAHVHPSERQKQWFDMEMYAFIHFGVNTFTDREWGDGTEPESIFDPSEIDCDQWVEAIKSAGLKGMVLTAKHHDGFCLWPSKYTEHSVKNAPGNPDVVKMAAEACRKGGIRFGFYLSPWDRNSKLYGTEEYNDYFCNQLTELLTGYGDIFYVWFDNACGEGPNGKKQRYDFPRYFELIRKYQPDAVIFNDFGPDIRWCGNEAGKGRHAEWSVVPSELCRYAEVQTDPGPLSDTGDLSYLYNTDEEIGTLSNILFSKGLVFCPSEIDVSIRKGWFWHEEEEPHSLERLRQIYLSSVGANACLNLNIPPNRKGLLDPRDVKRLQEFGQMLQVEFGLGSPVVEQENSGDELKKSGTKLDNPETERKKSGTKLDNPEIERKKSGTKLGNPEIEQNPERELRRNTAQRNLVTHSSKISDLPNQATFEVATKESGKPPRYVVLQEDLDFGQRVESFDLLGEFENGSQYPLYQGTTIGHKKICPLGGPFANQNPLIASQIGPMRTLTIRIKAARGPVKLKEVQVM